MGKKESFPKIRFSQSKIANGQRMLLPASCFQNQQPVLYLPHNPVLIDFVRIHFSMWRRQNVLRPSARRKTVFFTRVNNPIVWGEGAGHGGDFLNGQQISKLTVSDVPNVLATLCRAIHLE